MKLAISCVALAASALLFAGCQSAANVPQAPARLVSSSERAPAGIPHFVGFWESWSDRSNLPYHILGAVPRQVTSVDVAFSLASSNQISDPQNSRPLGPGMVKIHAHGGRVLLSIGGASSPFAITDVNAFEASLGAYLQTHPYDGVDFDDENVDQNTATLLTNLINATRQSFPNLEISFDAFMSATDPANPFEAAVLQNAGNAVSYVNVMDYDQYGYKPSNHPNCTFKAGSPDDCYLDALENFAAVSMPGGGTFPVAKIVMGLMIGPADDGAIITPHDATSYATWVRTNAYGGMMIWDADRDGPQGTGHPHGTYITGIGRALGA